MTYQPKQRQTAQILVNLSGGKKVQSPHLWLVQQLSDPQTVRLHLKLVKDLLERHLGRIGNLLALQNQDPEFFWKNKVQDTAFSSIRPMSNEPMFVYLTRLAKHLHAIEKRQLHQATRILTLMKN